LRGFPLLERLVEQGPLSPTDLAGLLELRTSTIAAHIDRLEELGWARRESSGRKGVLVSATDAGRAAHAQYLVVRRAVLAELLQPLAAEDLLEFARLTAEIVRQDEAGESER